MGLNEKIIISILIDLDYITKYINTIEFILN